MIYDPINKILFTNHGAVLKRVDCPLEKKAADLRKLEGSRNQYCPSCCETILDLKDLSDEEVEAELAKNPGRCVFMSQPSPNVIVLGAPSKTESKKILRRIKTARTLTEMNSSVGRGYRPLVKKIECSAEIQTKVAVYQNTDTGEVQLNGDYRGGTPPGWEEIISMFWYYPLVQLEPIAAYLIPGDIRVGEHVILEDLIEDVIGLQWNQGDTFRLKSAEAIWNGKDFDFDHYPQIEGFLG